MNERGVSLLEFLAATALGVVILGATVAILKSSGRELGKAMGHYEASHRELVLYHQIQNIAEDIDRHPLPIYPRFHRPGEITFADGTQNVISQNPGLAPSQQNTAITYATLRFDLTQSIDGLTDDGANLKGSACPKFGSAPIPSDIESFLALGPTNTFEILRFENSPDAEIQIADAACQTLYFTIPQSAMITEQQQLKPHLVRSIIPIRNIYTIYTSQRSELRYVSHRGESIVENQPILQDIGVYSLSFTFHEELALSELKLSQGGSVKAKPPITFISHVPRVSMLNFMLLRP